MSYKGCVYLYYKLHTNYKQILYSNLILHILYYTILILYISCIIVSRCNLLSFVCVLSVAVHAGRHPTPDGDQPGVHLQHAEQLPQAAWRHRAHVPAHARELHRPAHVRQRPPVSTENRSISNGCYFSLVWLNVLCRAESHCPIKSISPKTLTGMQSTNH